jgi:hypothetical protein
MVDDDDVSLAWGSDFEDFEVYRAIVAVFETAPARRSLWLYRSYDLHGNFTSATLVDDATLRAIGRRDLT